MKKSRKNEDLRIQIRPQKKMYSSSNQPLHKGMMPFSVRHQQTMKNFCRTNFNFNKTMESIGKLRFEAKKPSLPVNLAKLDSQHQKTLRKKSTSPGKIQQ